MGKLRVPAGILCKPGALDPEEFAAIKRHPEDGARLLADLGNFPPEVLALVLDHHERLDGAGYPRGLTEERLGVATRVLTVCDVYDALVSDRVYRPAWSRERALGLLHEESGAAFDPKCVAALEHVLAQAGDQPGWVAGLAPAAAPVRAPVPAR
jgi:HD-GYP domain-containing protein (c-di-GMP phosphodiesterase class II)